jgi:hypothetical protein
MITKENLKKIHNDMFERSIKLNLIPFPKNGSSTQEYDYKYCVSNIPELKDYIFVVSKKLIYKNSSLVDFKKEFYIYDTGGNFVKNQKMIDRYEGFHKTLQEINEDLS